MVAVRHSFAPAVAAVDVAAVVAEPTSSSPVDS